MNSLLKKLIKIIYEFVEFIINYTNSLLLFKLDITKN